MGPRKVRGRRARTIRRREEPPMMGVKCSAKERPRSVSCPFVCRGVSLEGPFVSSRTEVGGKSLYGAHMANPAAFIRHEIRKMRAIMGLSIISYASRYLLNIVPAYFSGEFACRGKRVSLEGWRGGKMTGARLLFFYSCGFRHGSICGDALFGLIPKPEVVEIPHRANRDRRLSRAPNTAQNKQTPY